VDPSVSKDGLTGPASLARAQELFGAGDIDGALAVLDAAPLDGATARAIIERRLEYRHLFGRVREAIADLRDGAHPTPAQIHARVADMALALGDPTTAIACFDRALAIEPRSATLHVARADALARLGASEAAAESLAQGVRASGESARYVEAAARIALGAGAFEAARTYAETTRDDDVRGHLALFAGDSASARTHANALLARDEATALTLSAGADALDGDDDAATRALDRALAADPRAWEARAWRAEILVRRGAFDEAMRELDEAIAQAPGFLVSARMARIIAALRDGTSGASNSGALADVVEIADAAKRVVPDARAIIDAADDPRAICAALRAALAAMRGNRTLAPSIVRDGRLVALGACPGPRFASRMILDRVATAPLDEQLAAFDPWIAAHPESGLPICHRGELRLWLGQYEAAQRDLDVAIATKARTRWAYIGLAALEIVEGRFERALETLARGIAVMDDTTGPAVYGVRGEALRRLGRFDDAIADLETACRVSPRRISAHVNLALAYAARGRTDDAARAFDHVRDCAYPLLHDAATELGAWTLEPLLETALASMLGNRSSSCVTWRSRGSPLRCLRITPGAKGAIDRLRAREAAQAPRTRARGPS
jgi:tetratricopeptide (TPR) repeat protein